MKFAVLLLLAAAAGACAQTVAIGSMAPQLFAFSFPGASHDQVFLRFGASNVKSCSLVYQGGAFNWLYLYKDDGTLTNNPATDAVHPGGTGALSNSQCTVPASLASVTTVDGVTSVTVGIAFCGSLAGAQPIEVSTYSYPNPQSAWIRLGVFNVPGILPATIPVASYLVTNAARFPSLSLPARGLVFRNGVFMTPAVDYDALGLSFRFRPDVLSNGDRISVVTLP